MYTLTTKFLPTVSLEYFLPSVTVMSCPMNCISSHWVDGIVEEVFSKVAILSNVSFTVSPFHVQFVEKKKKREVNTVYLMHELFNTDVGY